MFFLFYVQAVLTIVQDISEYCITIIYVQVVQYCFVFSLTFRKYLVDCYTFMVFFFCVSEYVRACMMSYSSICQTFCKYCYLFNSTTLIYNTSAIDDQMVLVLFFSCVHATLRMTAFLIGNGFQCVKIILTARLYIHKERMIVSITTSGIVRNCNNIMLFKLTSLRSKWLPECMTDRVLDRIYLCIDKVHFGFFVNCFVQVILLCILT